MIRSYPFRSALRSLWAEKWINALSVLTVASSLLMLTLIGILLYNSELITRRLPERFSLVVYLKENVGAERAQELVKAISKMQEVHDLTFISKDKAFKELRETLTTKGLLEGLDENPLTPSIEVRLYEKFVAGPAVRRVAAEIGRMRGVDEIAYGEEMVDAIYRLSKSVRNTGLLLFVSIAAGVVFVTYSTVKILFYRRKEEIEIWKLLGATRGFIRTPFLIEGGIIGLLGGGLGVIAALFFYFAITYRLSLVIPMLRTLTLPPEVLLPLPLAGMLLGVIGSVIAIGRLRL